MAPMTKQDAGSARNSEMAADAPAAAPPISVPTAVTWRLYDRNNLQNSTLTSGGVPYASTDAAQESGTVSKGGARSSSSEPLARLLDPFGLQQCLSTVAAVLPGSVTFVEYAYFEGSPALVISITSAGDQWKFVAGANCGQLGPDERYRTQLK
jgi:hypothetical protein